MKKIVCLVWLTASFFYSRAQLQPIGSWREHLPYHQAIAVSGSSNQIFAATPYSVFSVQLLDNSLHAFSKMTGLSATGVSTIAFDVSTNKLIIAYLNSDIDILKDDLIKNIHAFKESSVAGDKRIFQIYCLNGKAYLCTGIGIVVVDEEKYEIRETYVIGSTGQQTRVNALTSDKSKFYAATVEGLKWAATSSPNLSDYHNWQLESSTNGLSAGPITGVEVLTDDHPIVLKNDSLLIKQSSGWNLFYSSGRHIQSITKSSSQLVVCEGLQSTARVVILNADGSVSKVIQNGAIVRPMQAYAVGNDVWIADSSSGLVKYSGNTFSSYVPNSPQSIALGDLKIKENKLWASSGSVNASWVGQQNKNGLYRYSNNTWDNFNSTNIPGLDSLPDLIPLAIDVRDGSVWSGSFGGGLLQLKEDNSRIIFKQNSPLQSPPGMPGVYNVSGLAFDVQNNLWIANYGAAQNLHVRKADGNWRSFSIPFSLTENAVSNILIDDLDQKWIISPKGNGLICFNHGASIDNTGDDQWRIFKMGQGNGNLPDNNVLSIAKDKSGFIWVGTSNGVAIIPCTQQIFGAPACEAVIPVVQQGSFNGYLFNGEQVQAIAVDGADRKWIGTKHGAWLISADGEKTIYHFTADQSPLLDDDVRAIAIDGSTGEVFFATTSGICSFRSTATEGGTQNANVLVFPNPVPPTYTGQIAVRGLVENATVKITELDGRLVYQARALGGQVIWNGKDYKGKRVASGIYLVLITDDTRKENLATKIVFLH